jgi:hypothetical protein
VSVFAPSKLTLEHGASAVALLTLTLEHDALVFGLSKLALERGALAFAPSVHGALSSVPSQTGPRKRIGPCN